MLWEGILTSVSAGVGTLIVIVSLAKRYLRNSIQSVVDASVNDVIQRQAQFENRVTKHLDRQDSKLERIENRLT